MLRRDRSGSGRAGRISEVRRRAQHLPQLHLGKRRAGAAAHAASERDPGGLAWRRPVEPALGPERRRVRPQVLAPHRQPQARRHLNPGGQVVPADARRREQQPRGDGQRRAHAHHLLDDRVEVRGVALSQASVDGGIAREPLERPRQRRRRAVVAADQQRHQLVAQVTVRRGVALLVALLEQEVEHRVAARLPAPAAPPARAAPRRSARPPRRKRPHGLRGPKSRITSAIARICGSDRTVPSADSITSRRRAASPPSRGAEHDPQDHLERQLAHPLKRHHAAVPGRSARCARARRSSARTRASARRGTGPAAAAARAGARLRRAAGSSARPANGRRNSQLWPAGAIAGSSRKISRTASGWENSTIGCSVQ